VSTPALWVVLGPAGSGKSTVARHLARLLRAAYLDKDAMSSRFVEAALRAAGHDPGDRETNRFYLDELLPSEYDSLLDVAGQNLSVGTSVVLDAPFSPYLGIPGFLTDAARRLGWPDADLHVLGVRVPMATLRRRLTERGLHRDTVKLARWEEFWSTHGQRPCTWTGVQLHEVDNDDHDDPVTEQLHLTTAGPR